MRWYSFGRSSSFLLLLICFGFLTFNPHRSLPRVQQVGKCANEGRSRVTWGDVVPQRGHSLFGSALSPIVRLPR